MKQDKINLSNALLLHCKYINIYNVKIIYLQ